MAYLGKERVKRPEANRRRLSQTGGKLALLAACAPVGRVAMHVYVVGLKVVPHQDHPRFFEVGGGVANVWVTESAPKQAAVRAAAFIQLARWEVVEVLDCQEMTPKPEVVKLMEHSAAAPLPMDSAQCDVPSLRHILEAYRFGFAYTIEFYAPGGEEAFLKLQEFKRKSSE
jgi:hypothetical protein